MRAWERLTGPSALCGRCGRQLETGDPIFVFTIERGTMRALRRIRCELCEGPAPNLAPLEPGPVGFRSALPRVKSWAEMEALRAFGIREPGEEG